MDRNVPTKRAVKLTPTQRSWAISALVAVIAVGLGLMIVKLDDIQGLFTLAGVMGVIGALLIMVGRILRRPG